MKLILKLYNCELVVFEDKICTRNVQRRLIITDVQERYLNLKDLTRCCDVKMKLRKKLKNVTAEIQKRI